MHGGNKMKQVVNAQNAPAAIGPYSHCVKVGKMVFTSGQIGIDPAVGGLVEGVEAQRNLLKLVDLCKIVHILNKFRCFYDICRSRSCRFKHGKYRKNNGIC